MQKLSGVVSSPEGILADVFIGHFVLQGRRGQVEAVKSFFEDRPKELRFSLFEIIKTVRAQRVVHKGSYMSVLITAALARGAVACAAPDESAGHFSFRRNISFFNIGSPGCARGPLSVVAAD